MIAGLSNLVRMNMIYSIFLDFTTISQIVLTFHKCLIKTFDMSRSSPGKILQESYRALEHRASFIKEII